MPRQEVEKIPLRHEDDIGATHRQMREIAERYPGVADLARKLEYLLVGQLQEFLEQAELVHHLQRRGMDGVAAEIAEEIPMLFEHDDIDAGARQR